MAGLHSLTTVTLLTAVVIATMVAPASAAPLERVHFHDSSSEAVEDFCEDLTVRIDFEVDGTFLFNAHGPDGLGYALETIHGSFSVTNLANDKSLTQVVDSIFKDLEVTDNGDGTLTILILATGGERWYGPDGTLLFRNPGQIREEILVDHAGTPTDPTDDVFLESLGLVQRVDWTE